MREARKHDRKELGTGRQVARWQAQLDSYAEFEGYPGPEIPGVERVATWLEANRPVSAPNCVSHSPDRAGRDSSS